MSIAIMNKHILLYIHLIIVSLWVLTSCSLEDERDLCCSRNIMHYTFFYAGEDKFNEVVSTMEYFLFDEHGSFINKLNSYKNNLSYVSLDSLSPGKYTLIGLANRDNTISLEEKPEAGLQRFSLTVNKWTQGQQTFESAPPIYWSSTDFEIKHGEQNTFKSSMNHIHSSLRIRIEWESIPPFSDGYYFTLTGVGHSVAMNANGAQQYDGFTFPKVKYAKGTAYVKATLRQMTLEERIISLRYTNDHIPIFRLWHKDTPITPPIDLSRAFKQWKWFPDKATIQDYGIRMLIRSNGKIEVHQEMGTNVNDWIDGGTKGF